MKGHHKRSYFIVSYNLIKLILEVVGKDGTDKSSG